MNKVCITGRIVKDPELKIFENNTSLCTFFIANESFQGKSRKTGLYRCTAWGKSGRTIAYHAEKGSEMTITGRLNARTFEDRNGDKKHDVSIIIESFDLKRKPAVPELKAAS